jgi:glycine cleavage system H protein
MSLPKNLRYSETHEWFRVDGDVVTIGITQHAADELTDITYVELPKVGKTIKEGDPFGEVESVKATSELFSAVGGEVVEINNELGDHPDYLNSDPFGKGWIVKIRTAKTEPLNALMDAGGYGEMVGG